MQRENALQHFALPSCARFLLCVRGTRGSVVELPVVLLSARVDGSAVTDQLYYSVKRSNLYGMAYLTGYVVDSPDSAFGLVYA